MVRVVVTGGRRYRDYVTVRHVFERITKKYGAENLTLICGMAGGADGLAWQCANAFAWKNIEEHPAKWNVEGRAAGVKRNQRMVEASPTFCVAFPGGTGTADMIRRCYDSGITVWKFGAGERG